MHCVVAVLLALALLLPVPPSWDSGLCGVTGVPVNQRAMLLGPSAARISWTQTSTAEQAGVWHRDAAGTWTNVVSITTEIGGSYTVVDQAPPRDRLYYLLEVEQTEAGRRACAYGPIQARAEAYLPLLGELTVPPAQ